MSDFRVHTYGYFLEAVRTSADPVRKVQAKESFVHYIADTNWKGVGNRGLGCCVTIQQALCIKNTLMCFDARFNAQKVDGKTRR